MISRRSGWSGSRCPKRSTTSGGKYSASADAEVGVVGERRLEHLLAQQALGVREEHAQLRPGHAVAGGDRARPSARPTAAPRAGARAGCPRLELDHQILVRLHAPRRDRRPPGSGSGPGGSCRRATSRTTSSATSSRTWFRPSSVELAALDRDREQDLQVDLVIRAVDAGRVVDRVGVDAPAAVRVLDAAALGEAQVPALADDACSAGRGRRRGRRRSRGRRPRRASRPTP